jgi:hypothetical protein
MEKLGFIKPDSYMDYNELVYGFLDDEKAEAGKILGRVFGSNEPFERAKKALKDLGCTRFKFIPLYIFKAEIYDL